MPLAAATMAGSTGVARKIPARGCDVHPQPHAQRHTGATGKGPADGLAFIAPVHFCNFPAILRGWIERVFTYGFAYGLTEAGSVIGTA